MAMDLTPALEALDDRERIFVEALLRGQSQIAAATAAGYKSPARVATSKIREPHIMAALQEGRAISAKATGITLEKLNDMLMSAYHNAETAGEQVQAVMALAKLNGMIVNTSKVEVKHQLEAPKSDQDLKSLPTNELLKLAKMEPHLVIEGDYVDLSRAS